jgi:hypothetical protein
MKKLLIAFVAGFMSLSLAGAYAADDKKETKKADSGMSKAEKKDSMAKDDAGKDGDKKKGKKKDETK